MISSLPLVMLVNLDNPAKTVPEFIAWAKANPGKVNMASGGTGSASHIGGEFFKTMAGVDMLHVPYKGGAPATTDLMGGTIQVYFSPLPESIGVVKGGKVRALAVTTAKRVASLPDVPTIGESVPGFEISTWQGIGAPKNTPAEIVAALNKEINAGLADPKVKAPHHRARRRAVADLDRRFREARGRRDRAMGQGHPRRQDTAAVKSASPLSFHSRPA